MSTSTTVLYDTLYDAMTKLFHQKMEGIYTITIDYYETRRIYTVPNHQMSNIIDDILHEHPRILTYREAYNALLRNEHSLVRSKTELDYKVKNGIRVWKCDYTSYMSVRDDMFDLSISGDGKRIAERIQQLGPNPTYFLSNDVVTSKKMCSVLINKLWRTKEDAYANLPADIIKARMINDIIASPVDALENNSYVFGAFSEYASYTVVGK